MENETTNSEQAAARWHISLDWYQQNGRSLATLAQGCLCPRCRKQWDTAEEEPAWGKLLTSLKDCCSQAPDFITDQLPLLESAFRFFLANGNQPLDLEELGRQISERRGGDAYRTSPEILSRLLRQDRYYGLQEVSEP